MKRRDFLRAAAAAVPGIAAGRVRDAGAAPGLRRMNVILFLTDQERAIQHFPPGWAARNLPGLTRLMANGLTFDRAFCSTCMCSPSRTTLLTGFFPAQHLVTDTL